MPPHRSIRFPSGLFKSAATLPTLVVVFHLAAPGFAPAFAAEQIAPGKQAEPGVSSADDSPAIPFERSKMRVVALENNAGWEVFDGEDLFAGYRVDSGGKPIVYPLTSPRGLAVTRNFPMLPVSKYERSDHDHHRSVWLTHGEVNGIDFWLDDQDKGCGTIRQRGGSARATSKAASVVISTTNDWVTPKGDRVLSDTRTFTFRRHNETERWVDCDFTLTATDGDVHFGDTKEGTFGIRVAGSMKVDAGLGGKTTNAAGQSDKQAWGKKSPWVDYTGPALPIGVGEPNDQVPFATAGVTILYHPSSHGFPCRWHTRNYGLFAANPFGTHHFTGGPPTDGHTLADGESLTLRFRMVIRDGEFDPAAAASAFERYASAP